MSLKCSLCQELDVHPLAIFPTPYEVVSWVGFSPKQSLRQTQVADLGGDPKNHGDVEGKWYRDLRKTKTGVWLCRLYCMHLGLQQMGVLWKNLWSTPQSHLTLGQGCWSISPPISNLNGWGWFWSVNSWALVTFPTHAVELAGCGQRKLWPL